MNRIPVIALAITAVLTCTAPAAADSGQWMGPGTEHDYCAGLLEWGRQHPEIREFDGWPAYCRETYPDLTTTTTTSTLPPAQVGDATVVESPPAPVVASPEFTG